MSDTLHILVRLNGFIGDTLFQSSAFKGLRKKYPGAKLHILAPLQQTRCLINHNRHIQYIHPKYPDPYTFCYPRGKFDLEIHFPTVDQASPATYQMQAAAGIPKEEWELGYEIYVSKYYERLAKPLVDELREKGHRQGRSFPNVVVAVQENWAEKSFLFTREQYERAVDVPYLGYGGAHRDIGKIRRLLAGVYNLHIVPVGLKDGIVSNTKEAQDYTERGTMLDTAEFIKACDYFIGSEGGLSNTAAGVGTKCIITTDFIHQLYGPKGVLKRISDPQMGPRVYFPEAGHVHLDPFLTDEQVAESIFRAITLDQINRNVEV